MLKENKTFTKFIKQSRTCFMVVLILTCLLIPGYVHATSYVPGSYSADTYDVGTYNGYSGGQATTTTAAPATSTGTTTSTTVSNSSSNAVDTSSSTGSNNSEDQQLPIDKPVTTTNNSQDVAIAIGVMAIVVILGLIGMFWVKRRRAMNEVNDIDERYSLNVS